MTPSWSSFLPGLVVLAIGLAIGLLLAARLRRGGEARRAAHHEGASKRDLELERDDLEARRQRIYARLRGDAGEEMEEGERRELELQAARILRRSDELDSSLGRASRRAPPTAAAGAPAPARAGARPVVVGFAFGAGFAALAALLLYWAARDATPRPGEPAAAPAAADGGSSEDSIHGRLDQLSPEGRARVTAILARLETQPDDLDARKALAETLVVEGAFFEAFEQSNRILEQSPGDVDGLYFQGLVRLTMGQDDIALELLDQALATAPDFVSARLVRGLARLRRGERQAAIEDWQAGLAAAGGGHPGLERLLEMAGSGASAEEILGAPPPGHPSMEAAGDTATAPAAAAPAGEGGAYVARLELAPGASAPAGAILFVNLRTVAGAGPPAAVKRVDSPTFPLEITLGSSDAMPGLGGRPLPPSGVISGRLDTDGNASTRDPSEPSGEVEATRGEPVTLILK